MEGVTRDAVGVDAVSADNSKEDAATANDSQQESDMDSDKVSRRGPVWPASLLLSMSNVSSNG